jgi:5-methylcytosine-specific restriction endonuclease McrA
VNGAWFDEAQPYVSRTYLREPVLCHGHELVGYGLDLDEDLSDLKPRPRNCSSRPALTEITTCYLCLEPLSDPIQMDHVLPRTAGGEDGLLMPVHARCNLLKSDRALISPAAPSRTRKPRRRPPRQSGLWKPDELIA